MKTFALIRDGLVVDRHAFPVVAELIDGAVTWAAPGRLEAMREVTESREVEVDGEMQTIEETRTEVYFEDGIVTHVVSPPEGCAYIADADAQIGWAVIDGTAMAPEPPAPSEVTLLAHAADRRWRIETGGVLVAGVPIATDDRAKIMIMGARVAAAADPGWSTVWHGTDGETYPVGAAAMIAISDAVEAHVNATFAAFATIRAGILAGTLTTIAAIDAAFET